jgi:hypothetical protein
VGIEGTAVQVNGRSGGPQVEGERASARDPQQGSREEVLAAVLLHVVAAPLPVDDAGDSFFIRRSFQYVNHVVALLVDARPRRSR